MFLSLWILTNYFPWLICPCSKPSHPSLTRDKTPLTYFTESFMRVVVGSLCSSYCTLVLTKYKFRRKTHELHLVLSHG